MFTYALKSNLLAHQPVLQQIANKSSRIAIRKGHRGSHVSALQRGLNSIYRRSRLRLGNYKTWHLLEVDGKFGENTYTAVKAFQGYFSRRNKIEMQGFAEAVGFVPGTKAYKRFYINHRVQLDQDGIIGAMTLLQMDNYLLHKVL